MDFKPGDVVQLKSGGETMTVEEVGDDYVSCVWFNAKKSNETASRQSSSKPCPIPSPNSHEHRLSRTARHPSTRRRLCHAR